MPLFSISRGAEARRLYHEHIRGAPAPFFALPMTPAQIRELADRGHTIGNHTLSHVALSDVPEWKTSAKSWTAQR